MEINPDKGGFDAPFGGSGSRAGGRSNVTEIRQPNGLRVITLDASIPLLIGTGPFASAISPHAATELGVRRTGLGRMGKNVALKDSEIYLITYSTDPSNINLLKMQEQVGRYPLN
jgi:hypothetical protein